MNSNIDHQGYAIQSTEQFHNTAVAEVESAPEADIQQLDSHITETDTQLNRLEGRLSELSQQGYYELEGEPNSFSETQKTQFDELGQRIQDLRSGLEAASNYTGLLNENQNDNPSAGDPIAANYETAREITDTTNQELQSLTADIDAFAQPLQTEAPTKLIQSIDQTISQLNAEALKHQMRANEHGNDLDLGENSFYGAQANFLRNRAEELMDQKSFLTSTEFTEAFHQDHHIRRAEAAVDDAKFAMNAADNLYKNESLADADNLELAANGLKFARDVSVSAAQALGGILGGPYGAALGGMTQTVLTRLGSTGGAWANEQLSPDGYDAKSFENLNLQAQNFYGPVFADVANATFSPLTSHAKWGGGDFLVVGTTTLITELSNGESLGDSLQTAFYEGARAEGISRAVGGLEVIDKNLAEHVK